MNEKTKKMKPKEIIQGIGEKKLDKFVSQITKLVFDHKIEIAQDKLKSFIFSEIKDLLTSLKEEIEKSKCKSCFRGLSKFPCENVKAKSEDIALLDECIKGLK